jgi:hypothetical protein
MATCTQLTLTTVTYQREIEKLREFETEEDKRDMEALLHLVKIHTKWVYMHMYVCMYACMYVCKDRRDMEALLHFAKIHTKWVYMYICMYVCMYVCMHVCM